MRHSSPACQCDPELSFTCDVCGDECAPCCGVSESETCDECEGKKMEEKNIATIIDDNGEAHSCIMLPSGRHVLRIGDRDVSPGDYFRIFASDALELLDASGQNTTANALRAELAAANETIAQLRTVDTVRPGPNYMDIE